MGTLVRKTLGFIKQECDDFWKPDHDEVMRNYEDADRASEAAKLYSCVYEQLKSSIERPDCGDFDLVLSQCATLDLWYEGVGSLLDIIESTEANGFEVENSQIIREQQREAALLLEDMHDSKNAIEAVKDGRSISLEDFLDELRHPVHR